MLSPELRCLCLRDCRVVLCKIERLSRIVFCYITDTVTGLMLLVTSAQVKREVVNIGNALEVSILELAQKIKAVTKCKSSVTFHPLPKDDPKRRCPDTSKLEKLVGWKPKINFEEGLKRTIMWFK